MTLTAPELRLIETIAADLRELKSDVKRCQTECVSQVREIAPVVEEMRPKVADVHEWRLSVTGKLLGAYVVACFVASMVSILVGVVWTEVRPFHRPAPIASVRP